MKTNSTSQSAFFIPRIVLGSALCATGVLLGLAAASISVSETIRQPATSETFWIKLNPVGRPPVPRELFVAVYDAATNRMIIHGGGSPTTLSDAWVLTNADGTEIDSPTWTKLLPANPLLRANHAAVYDTLSNRIVVFGGQTVNGNFFNDVWILTNANGEGGDPEWIDLTPSGGPPVPRTLSSAIYDPASNRMTIFGGNSDQGEVGDVWVLTNANGTEITPPTWIQLFPKGSPIPARSQHSAVYDANTNRMITFGGAALAGLFNDVWVLTNANGIGGDSEWIELAPDGTPPSARYGHIAKYDPATMRMVVFGGTNNVVSFNDSWVLTNADNSGTDTPTWIRLAPSGTLPATRNQLGAAYSVSTNRLSIFGGDNAPVCCNLLNDVWVLPDANGIVGNLTLTSAASRKTHGNAGTFDIDLPLTGTPGVECRVGNGGTFLQTIVFTFSEPVTNVSGTTTTTCGRVNSTTISGSTVTVELGHVTCDGSDITVTVPGVNGASGSVDASATMTLRTGDVNADGRVGTADLMEIRMNVGRGLVTEDNFRDDITVDGKVNHGDTTLEKSKL